MMQTGATVYKCDRCKKIHVNTLLEGEAIPKDWGIVERGKELCLDCYVIHERLLQSFYSPNDFNMSVTDNGVVMIEYCGSEED